MTWDSLLARSIIRFGYPSRPDGHRTIAAFRLASKTVLDAGDAMSAHDSLYEFLSAARKLGFQIRNEHLGGRGGGVCVVRGQRWLFVDLSIGNDENLEILQAGLRDLLHNSSRFDAANHKAAG